METEDARQDPATVTSRVVTISVWLVVMLVGYVASIGPAFSLLSKGLLSEWLYMTLYAPLFWLYRLNDQSWFARSLDWWLNWWVRLALT